MSSTFATRALTAVLAAFITLATVSGMNALARHEYRVAVAAQEQPMMVASTQVVTIVGRREM